MTVRELIEELEKQDPERTVAVEAAIPRHLSDDYDIVETHVQGKPWRVTAENGFTVIVHVD